MTINNRDCRHEAWVARARGTLGRAAAERGAIADLQARASAPIRLPEVAELTRRVQSLDALADPKDPVAAREALKGYLKGGSIVCAPEGDTFVARAELLPLAVMFSGPEVKPPSELEPGGQSPRVVARGRYYDWTAWGRLRWR